MVAWARWIPSGILSAPDTIFLIKDAIACGSTAYESDLLVEVGWQGWLDGKQHEKSRLDQGSI